MPKRKSVSYRVEIDLPGRTKPLTTASFAFYADADRWARGYAQGQRKPCTVRIVSPAGISACYRGDGTGAVRAAPGEAAAPS